MPTQTLTRPETRKTEEVIEEVQQTEQPQDLLKSTDDLMDEIDEVLETCRIQDEKEEQKAIKLSDLMRMGAQMHPKAIGWYDVNAQGEVENTCALTASWFALQELKKAKGAA
jgi:hypothetical protein